LAYGKRRLGKSGLGLSVIGLGLWAVGCTAWGKTDDRESLRTFEAALAAGVNFFDTADVCRNGHREQLLGQAMRGRRHRVIVETGWRRSSVL